MAIWKYKSNGTLDGSFNGKGFVTNAGAAGGNGNDIAYGIVLDGSGNIYVAGVSNNSSNDDMVILKYR